jgi:[acyl-carrier-protein] S-malonyltransferase
MDRSRATADGAMLAVIGLATPKVEEVCLRLREDGNYIIVSNYNCQGQLTLAGTRPAIDLAENAIRELEPRKLARVPVQGAWHCALLQDVVDDYRSSVLERLELDRPVCPVMDNVSGKALPEEPDQIRASLARHLISPVRWDQCVRTMIDSGAETFIEVGYGNMLTKFGFFIDRKKRHLPSSGID